MDAGTRDSIAGTMFNFQIPQSCTTNTLDGRDRRVMEKRNKVHDFQEPWSGEGRRELAASVERFQVLGI